MMTNIRRGTILLRKHTKRNIYYVAENDLRDLGDSGVYKAANVIRLRHDGVATGRGSAVVVNTLTGQISGFSIVADADVPKALRGWC